MIFFYNLLTLFYLPIAFIKLFYKKNFSFEEFKRIRERLGSSKTFKFNKNKNIIWVHAVSVGEVNASVNLIRKLKKVFPNSDILVTTTTQTGSKRLKQVFDEEIFHQYLPFDVIYFVKSFLRYWKPHCLILIETEIWPNIINQCFSRKIPILLLNGRLSNKSLKNYQRLKNLSAVTFSKIDMIISQSDRDKKNFITIGANSNIIHVDSSLKFDALDYGSLAATFSYDEKLIKKKKIITCASTHPKEEEILFESFQVLNDDSAHLVLAPRHPERSNEISEFLIRSNISYAFLNNDGFSHLNLKNKVTVVNEIGHLNFLYSISHTAFIGGTLIEHGGQNFLEPVKYGIPLSSGNSKYNFQEIADQLIELNILKCGSNVEEISSIWKMALKEDNPELIKQKSADYIISKSGSVDRSIEKIKKYI